MSSSSTSNLAPEPPLPGIDQPDTTLASTLRAALDAMPKDYNPRTRHFNHDESPTFTNRLIKESSPYLLQHAHNPVNWRAWSDEAFAVAKARNQPVLLSIGYATCHWCHVMERESFEDEEIAAYINQNYVAIKVDREERPDVDALYMKAVQAFTGRGGWPLTVILNGDRKPFFAGTYFPARDGDRGTRQGFITILKKLRGEYDNNPEQVAEQAKRLTQAIIRDSAPEPAADVPPISVLADQSQRLVSRFDPTWGGFGRAPKFPQPSQLDMLMHHVRRSGDKEASNALHKTLTAMAAGGMYDQVGGGFHRYSTDAQWLVPHFEKMLYDNAQLASLYLDGYALLSDVSLLEVADDVLRYMRREMQSPEGGFYSATDADSVGPSGEQEEGYYFTWTPGEIRTLFGPKSEEETLLRVAFGLKNDGNFEGRTILHRPRSLDALTLKKMPEDGLRGLWERTRVRLREARVERPAPLLDDKILAAWNGLAISAMARGSVAAGTNAAAFASAHKAASFVWNKMRLDDGRLVRSYRRGRLGVPGYLEDYAFVIEGFLDLAEVSAEKQWIDQRVALQKKQEALLSHPGGAYFLEEEQAGLITRQVPDYDGAVPSGNSVAARNLIRLASLTSDQAYRARAEKLLGANAAAMSRGGAMRMLSALDYLYDRPLEVAIITAQGGGDALENVLARAYLPSAVSFVLNEAEAKALSETVPWLKGKVVIDGKSTAYVCEHGRCELPTSDPAVFREQLAFRRE